MFKYAVLLPPVWGITSSALADTSPMSVIEKNKSAELQPSWSCYVASDAQARKEQVEHGMLPHVVFDGESKPVSVESRMASYKTPAYQ